MSGFLDELINDYHDRMLRHRNRPFLKAAMAACALVAIANGKVSFSQRVRVDSIMATLEKLQVFDPHEGVELFNECVESILAAPSTGHAQAVKTLQAVADNPETAQLLIRLCLAVSESRGAINLVEQIEIVTLCSLLEVDPAAVNLDTRQLPLTDPALGPGRS